MTAGSAAPWSSSPSPVRDWRAQLLDQRVSISEAAKAYRFVRAVLMTAADDRIIPRNPCRVRGAAEEKPDERPTLSVRQVYELADQMPDDGHRVLVLVAAFASLRWGEVTGLRRCHIDIEAGTVAVTRQHVQLDHGGVVVSGPKSSASLRTVALPAASLPAVSRADAWRWHGQLLMARLWHAGLVS
jgi:integrase